MKRAALCFALAFLGCSGSASDDDDGSTTSPDASTNRRDGSTVDPRDGGVPRDASTNAPQEGITLRLGGRVLDVTLDFGGGFIGERTAARTLTITNESTTDVTFHDSPISLDGASGEFLVTPPNTLTLGAGASTNLTVEYAPTALGRSSAFVRLHNASSDFGPTTFEVSGYGQAVGTPRFVGGGGPFVRVRTPNGAPGSWTTEGDRVATEPCPDFGDDHPRDLIRGIGYGDGTFVLAGGSCVGMLATSRDGIQWNAALLDPPYAGFYEDVVFVDGAFVAVGGLGGRARSTDGGNNWTVVGEYSKCHLRRAAVGNGRIVAVGEMFGMGCYSSSANGVDWTPIAEEEGDIYQGVAYGNGIFVATGFNRCDTSPDGVTWTACGPTAPLATSVWFANGEFIAFGPEGIHHSADGLTWSTTPGPWLEVIAFGNGRYVGAGVSTRATGATLEGLEVEAEGAGARDWVFGHAID